MQNFLWIGLDGQIKGFIMQLSADFLTIFVIFACIFSTSCGIISIIIALNAKIAVGSLEKSTHNITYVDPKWATPEDKIKEINELSEQDYPEQEFDDIPESDLDPNKYI